MASPDRIGGGLKAVFFPPHVRAPIHSLTPMRMSRKVDTMLGMNPVYGLSTLVVV
jgi:hypothetical protein